MRSDATLHATPVAQWSRDEVFFHLEATFDAAARQRPDLIEPYLIRLEGADEGEQMTIMREALAATFAKRCPAKRVTGHDDEEQA